MATSNVGGSPATQTKNFGPVVVSWTPGTVGSDTTCYVTVSLNQQVLAFKNLSAWDAQLSWNMVMAGTMTSSGNIVLQLASGSSTNQLFANSISWTALNTPTATASGSIGTW
jgi:hypothetical protein